MRRNAFAANHRHVEFPCPPPSHLRSAIGCRSILAEPPLSVCLGMFPTAKQNEMGPHPSLAMKHMTTSNEPWPAANGRSFGAGTSFDTPFVPTVLRPELTNG